MVYEEDDQRNRRYKMSRAKAPKKSSHKHLSEPCVLEYPAQWFIKGVQNQDMRATIGAYCPICGKVGTIEFERWYIKRGGAADKYPGFYWHENTPEAERELNPETRTLPTFMVKDPLVKFVDLDDKG